MTTMLVLALLALMPQPAAAQNWYPRHNFTVGAGAGLPGADLEPLFDPKFGFHVSYGYRFHPMFQADIGFQTIVGAAGIEDYLPTDFGYRRIRDFQYFLPMGGRVIIPLARGRLNLFAGGGGAYMRYSEHLSQPSDYYRIDCPFCTARSGWGYYATAGFSVALDRGQHFRIGFEPRVYRGHTDGEPLGAVPGIRTRDTWINVMGQFSFAF